MQSIVKSSVLLVIIGVTAIALSIISYTYYLSTTSELENSATNQIRSSARIQAHDLSASLDSKMDNVRGNLQILANSPALRSSTAEGSQTLLLAARQTTEELTDGYFWLDSSGRLVWSTNFSKEGVEEQYKDVDLSYRSYFTEPKRTHMPFVTEAIEPLDKSIPTIFISHPIIGNDGSFKGVVATGIRTETLGNILASELSPEMQGTVGLVDKRGTVLYASEAENIGKTIFSEGYQSYLKGLMSDEYRQQLNTFVATSMLSETGDSLDIETLNNGKITIAFSPVMLDSDHYLTLYVISPHVFASSIIEAIQQQELFAILEIAIVTAIAIGITMVILLWNRNLAQSVRDKTTELSVANKKLAESNDRLVESEKLQREFINVAAHELRTPIQPLLGIADILASQFNGKDKIEMSKAEVDMIIRNAQRLERLSRDILEISRIESNSLTLNKEPTNLNEKIRTIIEDEQKAIPHGKPLRLIFEGAGSDLTAEIDRSRIFEVLSNLISNAIKFTEEGIVTVSCERKVFEAIVSVRDSGKGIDPEIMPRLFTKFATKSQTGTGLGLYISKSIVDAHGGRIWATNNEGGKGATFSFSIPLPKEAQPSAT